MTPLEGIRILDLITLSGYCGMELADYGAEVIKIEEPGVGDPLRTLEPLKEDVSVHHYFRDRGKKSITLDLNRKEGRGLFRKLISTTDVILENYNPGTLEILGLDYNEMSKIRPSIVFGRTSMYGSSSDPAYPQLDLLAQAKSGIMNVTGFPEKRPTRIGFPITERYSASFLASAVCLGVYHAKDTGEGQIVETSLCGTGIGITEDKVITHGVTGEDPMRTGNAHPLINPYDILKCKDGYVAMGISSDVQWGKFCKAFDRIEWTTSEKYCSNLMRGDNYFGDLRVKIEELFSNYTMKEIVKICDDTLIPGTICSSTEDALEEAQLRERDMILQIESTGDQTIEMPGKPIKISNNAEEAIVRAPSLGEHNTEVYGELGIDAVELGRLQKLGVI